MNAFRKDLLAMTCGGGLIAVAGLFWTSSATGAENGPAGDRRQQDAAADMTGLVTIEASVPVAPPCWAVMERRLLDVMSRAALDYAGRYTRSGGTLAWKTTGGASPDDLPEAFYNFPLLYAMGGDERLKDLSFRQWNATIRQLTYDFPVEASDAGIFGDIMNHRQQLQTSVPVASESADHDERLNQALEEFIAAAEAGQPLTRTNLVEKYADVAHELAGRFDSLDFIHNVVPQLHGDADSSEDQWGLPIRPLAVLGDFRIRREIGRGGMGVLYEADQLSLGRRVAIKVLPFAAVLDERQFMRFKNEAQAAASLDHPNIVGVHSVGCERGVHYYAMPYIEGQSLAEVIGAMRPELASADEGEVVEKPSAAADQVDTKSVAAISTERSEDTPGFFRSVARLGVQAAEALEHAHQSGLVHRDIKPSNLMVDAAGHLSVTDFGLAMTQTGANLTYANEANKHRVAHKRGEQERRLQTGKPALRSQREPRS